MAVEGIFVGLPRKTIEKIRDRAAEMMADGKTIMSYSDGVTSTSKQFTMPPKDILREARYALDRMDGKIVRGLYTNYNRIVDR